MAKAKKGLSIQLIIILVLVFGLVAGTMLAQRRASLNSKAAAPKRKPATVVNFWPNTNGPITISNLNSTYFWMTPSGLLSFIQVNTNPGPYAIYGSRFSNNVSVNFQPGLTTAEIWGWTQSPCEVPHGYKFDPVRTEDGGNTWYIVLDPINFGALQNADMHCAVDPNRSGWKSFWAQKTYGGTYINPNLLAGAVVFYSANDGSPPPGYQWDIAGLTLNGTAPSNWPPDNVCGCSGGQVTFSDCTYEYGAACNPDGNSCTCTPII